MRRDDPPKPSKRWLDDTIKGAAILALLALMAVWGWIAITNIYESMIGVGAFIGFIGLSYVVGRLANRMVSKNE